MDLGIKPEKHEPGMPASPAGADKIRYPEFDVRDKHADEIREEQECEVGTPFEAKIKGTLTGNSKNNYSNVLTFSVENMDITSYGDGDEEKDETPEPDDEEKALGYKREKPPEKETPDVKAEDLY